MGTCASQHETEQNTSAVRGRLQVDTLHAQYVPANGSSFLQLEHRFQNGPSAPIGMPCARVHERQVALFPLPGAPDAFATGLAFLPLADLALQ
jgi:hypothetical protein